MSFKVVYRSIRTYQKHHIGGLIKSPSHTDPLPLASRKNNTLEKEMHKVTRKVGVINVLVEKTLQCILAENFKRFIST